MFNRKKRRDRSCEHVNAPAESKHETQVGFMSCGMCRDPVNAVVEHRNGFVQVVGLHCLGCDITLPVGQGFVIWPVGDAS